MSTKIEAPESYSKQKKASKVASKQKLVASKKAVVASAAKHNLYVQRAAKYAREYAAKERANVIARRNAKAKGSYFVEEEPKVIFAIRILGTYGVAPKVRKILQLLRLRQINNGVFLRVNKPLLNMLVRVTPYLTWGNPSLSSVKSLIYKRGYAKINRQRIAIRDNSLIEKHLGRFDVKCMEDIVHEIFTCGKNFKQVNSFLYPFKLKNAGHGGYTQKKIHFIEGGEAGDRKDLINALIEKMN